MTQSELDRAVARATGEDRRLVARMGFSPLSPQPQPLEEREPLLLDWDEVDRLRRRAFTQPPRRAAFK